MNVPNHETRLYTGVVLERIKHLPPGGKMGDLPKHLQHTSFVRKGAKKTGGPNLRLLRLEQDKPSLTVTAYIFNKFVHHVEDRYITPREAALLQDFPLDYEFKGTLGQVHKQIGNAVPVKLATAVAKEVANYFKRLNKRGTLKIASYFTGAGGLDLGFEQASDDLIQFETCLATDYGTPQRRRRLFFVAAKHLHHFQYPEPTHCEAENLLGLPLYRGAGDVLDTLPKPHHRMS